MEQASAKFQIIHETLQSSNFSVRTCCKMAHVSASGYYAWLKAEAIRQKHEKQDRKDFELILSAYNKRGYPKGAKGVYMCLLHRNPPIVMNIKKIRRLMKKFRLICPIRKPRPQCIAFKEMLSRNKAQNLVNREFEAYGPRIILLTDITYINYGLDGRAYLCTILDAFTKEILSYTLSPNMEIDFVKETVTKLLKNHGISLYQESIIHSDQGAHFSSYAFIEIVGNAGLRRSMSRRGNCWDNAPQESFYGHMKDSIKNRLKYCTNYSEVNTIIDDYMDYYNKERYQWKLAKLSPVQYYRFYTTGEYPIDINSLPKNKNPHILAGDNISVQKMGSHFLPKVPSV